LTSVQLSYTYVVNARHTAHNQTKAIHRRPCSDSRRVTVPYKLSCYYY